MSEKCPNCGAKLGGFFGESITEDDQIKNLNKTIKDLKDKMRKEGLGDSAKDLEEKEQEGQKDTERRSISFNAIFQSKTDHDRGKKLKTSVAGIPPGESHQY